MADDAPAAAPATERMLRSALAYVERFHCYILPLYEITDGHCACKLAATCTNAGKHPRAKAGLRQASNDPERVREWWTKWPNANIGLALGESLALAIAVDPASGGDATLSSLQRANGTLPATPISFTGGGGRHYIFARPEHEHVRGKPLGRGVDVKADGSYIVLPPSTHASGQPYAWSPTAHMRDVPPSDTPAWIVAQLDTSARNPHVKQPADGLLGAAFEAAGWLGHPLAADKAAARCPWEDEHAEGARRYDGSTMVMGPTQARPAGHFRCTDAACRARSIPDLWKRIPEDAKAAARTRLKIDPAFNPFAAPPAAAPAAPGVVPDSSVNWESGLSFDDKGRITKDVGNAAILLRHSSEWSGVLTYNEFSATPEFAQVAPPIPGITSPQPGDLKQEHIVHATHWLRKMKGVTFARQAVLDAVEQSARDNAYHPVRNYLNSVKWDGVPRLNRWMHLYLGAADNLYTNMIGRWWMISAVARAFKPGCQADHMAILEGPQGAGKSSAVRILGHPWFQGSLPDLRNARDSSDQLYGSWLIEVAELDAFSSASLSSVKRFVSLTDDVYRPAYARFKVRHYRSCVFIGTTNDSIYLRDSTGARRFWPIKVRRLLRDELERDRDALWAEAVQAFEDGCEWWPTAELASIIAVEQEARFETDPWEELIENWLWSREDVSMMDILGDALKLEPRDQSRAAQDRAASVLRRLGYERTSVREGTRTRKMWVRVPAEPPPAV